MTICIRRDETIIIIIIIIIIIGLSMGAAAGRDLQWCGLAQC